MTFEGSPASHSVSLNLEVFTQRFNGRWQAWYGTSDSRLLSFNCETEGQALTVLLKELKRALDDAR